MYLQNNAQQSQIDVDGDSSCGACIGSEKELETPQLRHCANKDLKSHETARGESMATAVIATTCAHFSHVFIKLLC